MRAGAGRVRSALDRGATSPAETLGHAAIRKAVTPIDVANGEDGMNRVLSTQMFQTGGIDYCHLNTARPGSVNEVLAVYLLPAGFDVPGCPHAGGACPSQLQCRNAQGITAHLQFP